jgi:hypothetical protein
MDIAFTSELVGYYSNPLMILNECSFILFPPTSFLFIIFFLLIYVLFRIHLKQCINILMDN